MSLLPAPLIVVGDLYRRWFRGSTRVCTQMASRSVHPFLHCSPACPKRRPRHGPINRSMDHAACYVWEQKAASTLQCDPKIAIAVNKTMPVVCCERVGFSVPRRGIQITINLNTPHGRSKESWCSSRTQRLAPGF